MSNSSQWLLAGNGQIAILYAQLTLVDFFILQESREDDYEALALAIAFYNGVSL
ncbi:hypothetical protein GCM10011297_35120 [Bacterioplanes sanyensis]|nr:hypothetical protein GCM10011297_35120 [Bacterioplanes sanyensis]